jgi:hypothetical protein
MLFTAITKTQTNHTCDLKIWHMQVMKTSAQVGTGRQKTDSKRRI